MSQETANRLECRYFDEQEQSRCVSAGLILPDIEAQSHHWACQVAELRRFNKRLELVILQLGGRNRHLHTQIENLRGQIEALEGRSRRAEEEVRYLEDRLRSLRHRVAEKMARLVGRASVLRVLSRYLLLKAAVVYRVLRAGYRSLRHRVESLRRFHREKAVR